MVVRPSRMSSSCKREADLWGFFTPPVAGADLRAALVASCLRGALPPVDFLAVCLVRAMAFEEQLSFAKKMGANVLMPSRLNFASCCRDIKSMTLEGEEISRNIIAPPSWCSHGDFQECQSLHSQLPTALTPFPKLSFRHRYVGSRQGRKGPR